MPSGIFRVEHRGRGGFVHTTVGEQELALPIEMREDGSFTVSLQGSDLPEAKREPLRQALQDWFARSGRAGWTLEG